MLLEELLVEHLGNLKDLRAGKLIDVLKQSVYSRKHGGEEGPISKQFNRDGGVGATSEIKDVGTIKDLGDIRKAVRKAENAKAVALYVDGVAVAVIRTDDYTLSGSSRTNLVAFDLTPLQAEIEKDHAEKLATASDWDKKYGHSTRPRPLVSRYEKEHGYREKEILKYEGKAMSTGELKLFVDELKTLAGDRELTAKIVLQDLAGHAKRRERHEAMNYVEVFNGLKALKVRLAKYKISKKPTAETIEDFLQMALEQKAEVVQFGGRGFSTAPGSATETGVNILAGKPFSITYRSVDPGAYDSINVTYAFDPATGTLAPYKANWTEKGYKTVYAVLDHERHLKTDFGLKSLDKPEAIKKLLGLVKDGQLPRAQSLLNSLRAAGMDWPELDVVQKSLDAGKKS